MSRRFYITCAVRDAATGLGKQQQVPHQISMFLFLPILLVIMSFITLKYYGNTSKRSAEDAGPSNSKKKRAKTQETQVPSLDASSLTHQLIHQQQPEFEPPIRTLPLPFKVLLKERELINLFLRLFS